MNKIIILQGLPASGKTTWAKEKCLESGNKYKRINKDDLRDMLDDGNWSYSNEKIILQSRDLLITNSLSNGYDVIVDDTNLHEKHIKHIKKIADRTAKQYNIKVEVEIKDFFHVSEVECVKRDLKREKRVGRKVILGMYERFLKNK